MNPIIEQGKRAFYSGKLDNPYKEGTSRHRDWQFGFDRAYFENLNGTKEDN